MTNICQLDNRRLFLRIGTYQGVTRGEIKEPRARSTHLVGWTRARDDGALQGGLAAIVALPSVFTSFIAFFLWLALASWLSTQQRDLSVAAIFDLIAPYFRIQKYATDCSQFRFSKTTTIGSSIAATLTLRVTGVEVA